MGIVMKKSRYYYIDEIYNSRRWYKKNLGKLAEKEVKKQIEVLLMYEYYHLSPRYYRDGQGRLNVKYKDMKWAEKAVKEKLSRGHCRLGEYETHPFLNRRVQEWYYTHKHLLKLK